MLSVCTYPQLYLEEFGYVIKDCEYNSRWQQVILRPEMPQWKDDGMEPLKSDGQGNVDRSDSECVHKPEANLNEFRMTVSKDEIVECL